MNEYKNTDNLYARTRDYDDEYQNLSDHLYETAELAEAFAEPIGLGDMAYICGLLHDYGKARADWQKYLRDSIDGVTQDKKDHATAGAQYIRDIFSKNPELLRLRVSQIAMQAVIMYHHGTGLTDMAGLDGKSPYKDRLDKNADESGYKGCAMPDEFSEALMNRAGQIASADKNFLEICRCSDRKKLYFRCGMHLRNLSSCLIDADRTDSACFDYRTSYRKRIDEPLPDWSAMLESLDRKLLTFDMTEPLAPVRKRLSDDCFEFGKKGRGVYTCAAMTSAGKTLASLRFALEHALTHRLKKIILVVPYTSIIDQNADVLRDVLEDGSNRGKIVLECHSSLAEDKKNSIYRRYAAMSQIWDAPVIVTTMVQFMDALYGSGTKKIRRMHLLSESVMIFDEIQTLPVKCTYLFNWGIDYLVSCCGSSALLCTATQPGLNRIGKDTSYRLAIPDGHEIVGNQQEHHKALQRVVYIDMTEGGRKEYELEEIADYVKSQMSRCRSYLAVTNTKRQARELYEYVKDSGCADYIYHLSTDMCPHHRKSVISEMKSRLAENSKVICISTCLIEAGVDISFEGAMRYFAGLDSIVQTGGRCNRHGEMDRMGELTIVRLKGEKLGKMTELMLGQSAMRRLLQSCKEDTDISSPSAVIRYFDCYYGSYSESKLMYDSAEESSTVIDLLSDNREGCAEYRRVSGRDAFTDFVCFPQAFETAWDRFAVISDDTTGVIVPEFGGKDIIGKMAALDGHDISTLPMLLRQSQQYTVNIYSDRLTRLVKDCVVYEVLPDSGIYALSDGYYDRNLGLTDEYCGSAVEI